MLQKEWPCCHSLSACGPPGTLHHDDHHTLCPAGALEAPQLGTQICCCADFELLQQVLEGRQLVGQVLDLQGLGMASPLAVGQVDFKGGAQLLLCRGQLDLQLCNLAPGDVQLGL